MTLRYNLTLHTILKVVLFRHIYSHIHAWVSDRFWVHCCSVGDLLISAVVMNSLLAPNDLQFAVKFAFHQWWTAGASSSRLPWRSFHSIVLPGSSHQALWRWQIYSHPVGSIFEPVYVHCKIWSHVTCYITTRHDRHPTQDIQCHLWSPCYCKCLRMIRHNFDIIVS